MKKQLEIFHSLVSEFQKDSTVEGILLNGSVAAGTATELSDLDMIVLGEKDGFVSKTIDTVLVEIHFVRFDSAVKKLESNPMEVYKYLEAKVEYDNGKARKIISYAENVFLNYRVPEKERQGLAYWLKSTKLKLEAAFSKQDMLSVSYLSATNAWKVLEGMWAVNQKPIPPSSCLYRKHIELERIPYSDWFRGMFMGDIAARGKNQLDLIGWILENI